jgi:hypothetical protein
MVEVYAHRPRDVKALLAAMQTESMEKLFVLQQANPPREAACAATA